MKTTLPIVVPIIGLSIDARHIIRLLPARTPTEDNAALALQADFLLIREHLSDENETDLQAHLVAAHVAGRLRNIGIVPEVDVFRSDPYLVARSLASLDILSNGQAGFAPFADPRGSLEIGYAKVGSDAGFVGEFIDAVGKLWNNWQPGALARDWAENRYVDNRFIRRADHEGEYFSIRGPLPTPTALQSEPLFIAQDHPAHRAIVGRAAAVIAKPGSTTNNAGRRTLIQRSLREVSAWNRQSGASGFLLHVGEDITSWSELQDLSATAAADLAWTPRSGATTLNETLNPHRVAELDGAAYV